MGSTSAAKPKPKPEQERPKESFFAFLLAFLRTSTFAKHAFFALPFATVPFFAGVVAPVFRGTVIGTLRRRRMSDALMAMGTSSGGKHMLASHTMNTRYPPMVSPACAPRKSTV